MGVKTLNPKNDQHQFSPHRIHTSSKEKAMRSNDHQRENFLAFYQNLSTSSFKKCFGDLEITVYICMCVDIGA